MCSSTNHPLGMLDRDQRTALTVERKINENFNGNSIFCEKCNLNNFKDTANKCHLKRNKTFNTKSKKSSYCLLICLCIWILSTKTIESAPAKSSRQINYCNFQTVHLNTMTSSKKIDSKLYTNTILPVHKILYDASESLNENLESYVQRTWGNHYKTVTDLHNTWSTDNRNWLNPSTGEFPKKFRETLSDEHRQNLLKSMADYTGPATYFSMLFERFQLLLLGFEQISTELNTSQSDQHISQIINEVYTGVHAKIQEILCELQTVLQELNVEVVGVDSVVMPDSDRSGLDSPARRRRNWVYLREYLNTLEYAKETIDILKTVEVNGDENGGEEEENGGEIENENENIELGEEN